MDYDEVVKIILNRILQNKDKKDGVLLVGIEGICNSGKSTLVENLLKKFYHSVYKLVVLEGDLFHRGRDIVHSLYKTTISALDSQLIDKCDFHHILTWKFDEMQDQLINRIIKFNRLSKDQLNLTLQNVLKSKENNTEHDFNISLDKNTILLIPCVFLRHLQGFDFIIYLDVDVDISVARKIERTKQLNLNRSFEFTREIITRLEYPTMVAFNKRIGKKPDMIINTNDWKDVRIKSN